MGGHRTADGVRAERGGVAGGLRIGQRPPPGRGHRLLNHLLPVDAEADQPLDGQQLGPERVDRRPQPGQGFLVLSYFPRERVGRNRLAIRGRGQSGCDHRGTGEPVSISQQRRDELGDQARLNPLAEVMHLVTGHASGELAPHRQVLARLSRRRLRP